MREPAKTSSTGQPDSTKQAGAMLPAASVPPAAPGRGQPADRVPSRMRRLQWLAASLIAAWLVPVALHHFRLDVIQIALLLTAVASILRSATNLLDRFMLAAGLLAGAVLALGLLFSVWPWRLEPVPVGGTLFTLVVLTAWMTRRRPSLPRRWLGSDAVVIGSGLFAFGAVYAPIAGLPMAKRFAFSAVTTDRFNQFALFDTIHRIGGYAFLHQGQARVSLNPPTQIVYPSGSHFLYAAFDIFLRSATAPGAPVPEFNRYFIYVLAGYALLVMAVVWAARWVAGPLAAGWRRFVICSAVAGLAISGPFVVMLEFGQDSEIIGLALLVLAVAVTVRPPRVVGEHVLIACALLIAVAYAYNLYAVPVGLGMVCGGVIYRRRLLRHWRFTAAATAISCAIAFYPSALSLASGFNAQRLSLGRGWLIPVPGPLLTGLALMIAATMTSAVSRRLPVWRAMTAQLLVTAAVIGGFAIYQLQYLGHTGYYYGKLLMAGYVVCLAGVGALGTFLRRLGDPSRSAARLKPLGEASLAVVAGAITLCLTAGLPWALSPTIGNPLIKSASPLRAWSDGKFHRFAGRSLAVLADAHLLGNGVPTIVLNGVRGVEWYDSYFAATLNRDLGEMIAPLKVIIDTHQGKARTPAIALRQALNETEAVLRASRLPLRLIVANPAFGAKLNAMLAAHHRPSATVLVVPDLRAPRAHRMPTPTATTRTRVW